MELRRVGREFGLEGSRLAVSNWVRIVVGLMASWKNWESPMVERADAKWLEKRASAVLEISDVLKFMFMLLMLGNVMLGMLMFMLTEGPPLPRPLWLILCVLFLI